MESALGRQEIFLMASSPSEVLRSWSWGIVPCHPPGTCSVFVASSCFPWPWLLSEPGGAAVQWHEVSSQRAFAVHLGRASGYMREEKTRSHRFPGTVPVAHCHHRAEGSCSRSENWTGSAPEHSSCAAASSVLHCNSLLLQNRLVHRWELDSALGDIYQGRLDNCSLHP